MKSKLTIAALMLMILATVANGAVTVTQVGSDLYVSGDKTNDDVDITLWGDPWYDVEVYDWQAGEWYAWYTVDNVYVETGKGNDDVYVYDYSDGSNADVFVDTGQGNDYVYVDDEYDYNTINICMGQGNDFVSAWTYYAGNIYIEMGQGNDGVLIDGYWYGIDGYYGYLNVEFGPGDDYIYGFVDWAWGTLAGGPDYDSYYLDDVYGFDVSNFEYYD